MTVIYVDCDYCNEKPVELQPDELRLYLSHPSGSDASYMFMHCGQQNWRPANQRITNTLLAAGVPYETVGEPRKLRAQDYQTIVLGRLALKSVDTVDDIGWVS